MRKQTPILRPQASSCAQLPLFEADSVGHEILLCTTSDHKFNLNSAALQVTHLLPIHAGLLLASSLCPTITAFRRHFRRGDQLCRWRQGRAGNGQRPLRGFPRVTRCLPRCLLLGHIRPRHSAILRITIRLRTRSLPLLSRRGLRPGMARPHSIHRNPRHHHLEAMWHTAPPWAMRIRQHQLLRHRE